MKPKKTRNPVPIQFKIALLLGSLLFCLVMGEAFARVMMGRDSMHFGIEMWKYARDVKVRAKNPEMSHRHRPHAEDFLMGVDVKINSHGLRDDEFPEKKPANTYRVLVLGDSTTFGWGASQNKLYTERLERSLKADPVLTDGRQVQVINTGVGNYNTSQQLAYLKDEGLKFDPDAIWICWFINDAEPTPVPNKNWLAKVSYLYVWLSSAMDSAMRNVSARADYRQYYDSLYTDENPGWQKCQNAYAELASICKERGIPLRILLLPELHTLGENYEFNRVRELMQDVGEQNDVPVFDLMPAFDSVEDPESLWVSPEDAHPNDLAMELIAKRLDTAIRQEQWIR